MLYKKYHRNHVREFRKHVEFVKKVYENAKGVFDTNMRYVVHKEPRIYRGRFGSISICVNDISSPLIFHNGMVNKNILIKNCTKNTTRIILGNLRDLLRIVRTWIDYKIHTLLLKNAV